MQDEAALLHQCTFGQPQAGPRAACPRAARALSVRSRVPLLAAFQAEEMQFACAETSLSREPNCSRGRRRTRFQRAVLTHSRTLRWLDSRGRQLGAARSHFGFPFEGSFQAAKRWVARIAALCYPFQLKIKCYFWSYHSDCS